MIGDALAEMKVSLANFTTEQFHSCLTNLYLFLLQNSTDQKKCNELLDEGGIFDALKPLFDKTIIVVAMVPLTVLLTQLDVIKDLILECRLMESIGWELYPSQFSSFVSDIVIIKYGPICVHSISSYYFFFLIRSSFYSCAQYLFPNFWPPFD